MLVNRSNVGKKCRNLFLIIIVCIGMFILGRLTRSILPSPALFRSSRPGVSELIRSGSVSAEQTDDIDDGGDDEGLEFNNDALGDTSDNGDEEEIDFDFEMKELKPIPWEYNSKFKNPCFGEAPLRCLPYFFIPGMVDSATTFLFRAIMHHPDAVYPGFEEANFFQKKTIAELEDGAIYEYAEKFSKAAQAIFAHSNYNTNYSRYNNKITGEASPYMTEWWNTDESLVQEYDKSYTILQYIKHVVPQAKIIVVFRNPVERVYSEYCRRTVWKDEPGWPSPDHFHEKALRAITMYNMLYRHRPLKKSVYCKETIKMTEIGLLFGMNYFYWQELMSVFSRDQILVIQFDKLFDRNTIKGVFEFLEMSEPDEGVLFRIQWMRWNGNGGGDVGGFGQCGSRKMHFRTRMLLKEFYEPFNMNMVELTKDEAFLYPIRT